jgi:hypothetical protein
MPLETFKAQLKAKIKTLGVNLSTTRIDAIAARLHAKNPDITEVADHDTRIDDFNDLSPLADIAKQDDRVRTLEAKTKGQPTNQNQDSDDDDANDDPPPAKPSKKKNSDEPPAWAKGLIETVSALTKEKTQTSMATQVAAKLKDVVPPKYYAGRALPEKEEDLESFIETVKTDYTEFKQDLINQGLMSSSSTPQGGSGGNLGDKQIDAGIDAWVKSKEEPTTEKK